MLGEAMNAEDEAMEAFSEAEAPLQPVAHETTDRTGIPNERGSIAFARLEPGTANSEFFFNVQDNPALETGYEAERPGA